jgi:hypothetical protein
MNAVLFVKMSQKCLFFKDANFLTVYVYVCMNWICLQTSGGSCAITETSSYGSYETENKQCGSCILTTKRVTMTNCYNILKIFN